MKKLIEIIEKLTSAKSIYTETGKYVSVSYANSEPGYNKVSLTLEVHPGGGISHSPEREVHVYASDILGADIDGDNITLQDLDGDSITVIPSDSY